MKRRLERNTPAEEAAIQRGMAADEDAFEWTDAEFAAARPAAEVMPAELLQAVNWPRGLQEAPAKGRISLRLDQDVLDRWRATGPGWQTTMEDALRKAVT